jgi:hypothetical protein
VVYERAGVRLFRRFVVEGDYFNRLARRTNPNPPRIRSADDGRAAARRGYRNERVHVITLALLAPPACALLFTGRWAAGGGLLLATVFLDLYPVILQRYTRSRLDHVASRLERRGCTMQGSHAEEGPAAGGGSL